jgi:homodimeric dihydroxyacetone kinase (EC 2.7.1.29)
MPEREHGRRWSGPRTAGRTKPAAPPGPCGASSSPPPQANSATPTPHPTDIAAGIAAGTQGVTDYGKAQVGDKTLVDALVPFSTTLTHAIDAGATLTDAWTAAADAATRAAAQTADLLPRMGRARTHGQHSLGTPTPAPSPSP